jgi:hypothetical protein
MLLAPDLQPVLDPDEHPLARSDEKRGRRSVDEMASRISGDTPIPVIYYVFMSVDSNLPSFEGMMKAARFDTSLPAGVR